MYRVVNFFVDLQDDEHPYEVGDVFPRRGKDVTKERLRELLSSDNRRGMPLIIEDTEEADAETQKARRKKGGARHDDRGMRVSPQLV